MIRKNLRDFTVDNHLYHCMEQYMMAQKAIVFKDYEMYREILATSDPKTCKSSGPQSEELLTCKVGCRETNDSRSLWTIKFSAFDGKVFRA